MTDSPPRPRPSFERAGERHGLSIQVRLLLLVAAAALPALLFSVDQARTASRVERANAERQALQLARQIAARVDDHINTVDALLVGLSRTVEVDPRATARNDSVLASLRRELGPRYLNLSVADRAGRIVGLSTQGLPHTGLHVEDRKYFIDAMRSRTIGIGEPMIGRVSNEYALALGRAVLDRDGQPVGVVAASTLLRQLRTILIPPDLPNQAVVTLVDSSGVVLARTKDADRWLARRLPPTMLGRTLRATEGVREDTSNGVANLSGFATAARVPWSVHVVMPSDVALERVHAEERRAVFLFAGSLSLSLLLAWLLARGIAGPVRALTSDAEAFAAGDFTHRSRVDADGELGTLASTFNRMIDALERRGGQLQESERRYRALFDMLPLPMWVYDVETLHFLAVNQAAIVCYGYSREEFLTRTVLDIRPAEDVSSFLEHAVPDRFIRRAGEPWRHRTRDGQLLDVEINSDNLQYGHRRARLVVAIDVTERLRTERALRESQEQLRQSQKMEAVGSLAGGIAHDFNNLLTAILGYCDLALDELASDHTASADVAEVRRAALRAAELTHQLLAFSRRQVLKPLIFPLGPAAAQVERILRRLISENIELALVVEPDTPSVCADPTQLEQVMLNLAVNARDAMPRGGHLRIRTGVLALEAPRAMSGMTLAPGRYALLEVTDTGTGIAPEVRDRLFEPFFTTKARGQGTGLGLATVYGVVQQSGGAIDVVSEVGRGTTFTAYFPVATASELEDGTDEPEEARYGSGRIAAGPQAATATILLAEDDEAVRAIARETLERVGYRVLSAPNGMDALALADGHDGAIDLLLTDVIMPGMNGRQLADALAQRQPGLRVLFASGYTDNVLMDQGALAPGVRLLDKPFTPAALALKVAEVLAASAHVAPADVGDEID
jgi:two-component system cell cycle sensor histidine kinase/response regulator CckA